MFLYSEAQSFLIGKYNLIYVSLDNEKLEKMDQKRKDVLGTSDNNVTAADLRSSSLFEDLSTIAFGDEDLLQANKQKFLQSLNQMQTTLHALSITVIIEMLKEYSLEIFSADPSVVVNAEFYVDIASLSRIDFIADERFPAIRKGLLRLSMEEEEDDEETEKRKQGDQQDLCELAYWVRNFSYWKIIDSTSNRSKKLIKQKKLQDLFLKHKEQFLDVLFYVCKVLCLACGAFSFEKDKLDLVLQTFLSSEKYRMAMLDVNASMSRRNKEQLKKLKKTTIAEVEDDGGRNYLYKCRDDDLPIEIKEYAEWYVNHRDDLIENTAIMDVKKVNGLVVMARDKFSGYLMARTFYWFLNYHRNIELEKKKEECFQQFKGELEKCFKQHLRFRFVTRSHVTSNVKSFSQSDGLSSFRASHLCLFRWNKRLLSEKGNGNSVLLTPFDELRDDLLLKSEKNKGNFPARIAAEESRLETSIVSNNLISEEFRNSGDLSGFVNICKEIAKREFKSKHQRLETGLSKKVNHFIWDEAPVSVFQPKTIEKVSFMELILSNWQILEEKIDDTTTSVFSNHSFHYVANAVHYSHGNAILRQDNGEYVCVDLGNTDETTVYVRVSILDDLFDLFILF